MLKKIIFVIIISITITCCKSLRTKQQQLTKKDLNGYWEQQGEGEIIEINDSLVISYHSSNFNCYPNWKITREYFNTKTPTITLNDDESFTNKEGFTLHTYLKLKEKPKLCTELTEIQKNNNTYNFETLWNTFNEQYVYFKERNIDWNVIKSKYQSKFNDKTESFEFYLLLEKMVLELKDSHSDFEVPDEFEEQWHKLNKKNDTSDYKTLAQNKILNKYLKNVKTYNDGQIYYGLINYGIGYVQLNSMEEIDNMPTIADSIISEIKNTKVCVIDLRFNNGGDDVMALDFLSHFIDKPYNVYTKRRRFKEGFTDNQTIKIEPAKNRYTKEIYVLTSSYTVSAAETAILATLNFPNFKKIGSNTNGAFSDILNKTLPNGWNYWLSNEVYEGMNGKNYEVSGIPPDYKIDYPREKEQFLKSLYFELDKEDRAIEKAMELIK
ncbi:S41 family peptidase [Pedobacter helvus]|uniref:S41 family peptidase n=1 Tax=Pedobacter helvus TaxID=2563444 RepID=A0ABW9JQ56_9SPHI|nr:S41 family peptidase [Pedobacter ureilyticus]